MFQKLIFIDPYSFISSRFVLNLTTWKENVEHMNTTPIDTLYPDDDVTVTDNFFRVTESNSVGGASVVDVYLVSIRILVGLAGSLGQLNSMCCRQ